MMATIGDLAASLGLPVFPCEAHKRPIVAKWPDVATTDPATILAMFNHPSAAMIGMPTGRQSGLIIIDVDVKNGAAGDAWLQENTNALPETRTHRTQSGGLHLVFRAPEGVEIRNSASRIAPGVDVRGEGGYVIWPGSPGYTVADNTAPAEMPRWLIRACLPPEPQTTQTDRAQGQHERYTQAAIDGEIAAVIRAGEGTRNTTLHSAAIKLGTLVGAGQISRADAEAELARAGQMAGLPSREVIGTIKSGLDFGTANPRQMPERAARTAAPDPPPADPPEYWDAVEAEPVPTHRVDLPVPDPPKIKIYRFKDIEPVLAVNELVEDVLSIGTMSVLYGPSNSGKTFFATDMSLHIACGWEWRGKVVEQRGVVYVAMEGSHGIRNRIAAFAIEHGLEGKDIPFGIVTIPIDMLNSDDPEALVAAINAEAAELGIPCGLIVMDTLARGMGGGNENAPDDMGALIRHGDLIRHETGAHLMWIHHSGKDEAKGARGHSSLRAATDTEIEIAATGEARIARVTKQRDMEGGGEFPFGLKLVEIGPNQRGKMITSCVVEIRDDAPALSGTRRIKGHTKRALEVLMELIAGSGQQGAFQGVPSGANSVPDKWWRERFYERAMPGDTDEAKQVAFRRAATSLVNEHLVGMANKRVWIVSDV